MKIILVAVACLGMVGCLTREESRGMAHQTMSELEYVKDSRTNLCFAVWSARVNHGLMTNVPCTTEVEALIAK